MARSGAGNLITAQQDVRRNAARDRLGIETEDERMKTDMLKALPGMEVAALQPELQKLGLFSNLLSTEQGRDLDVQRDNRNYSTDVDKFNIAASTDANKFNLGNTIDQTKMKNIANQGEFSELMKAWAAEQQAKATENSGGSWLCTEVDSVSPLSEEEHKALKDFKEYAKKEHPEEANFYLQECGELIAKMGEFDFASLKGFVKTATMMIQAGDLEGAYQFYKARGLELIEKYWPDCELLQKGAA
jgi:hypothetical protein